MLVPEAAVYKDHLAPWTKNYIRLSWKVLAVQAVSVTYTMQNAANSEFWQGV